MNSNRYRDHTLSPHTFYILLALYDRPLHGYAIPELVARDSAGDLTLTSPTLYRALARLTRDGLIRETVTPFTAHGPLAPGKPRRTYAIIDPGRAAFRLEVDRLKRASILGHQQLYGPKTWRML
jgi:DNA-binding PadR family transcriptional regulator